MVSHRRPSLEAFFDGSLRENVTYGHPSPAAVPDAVIARVLRSVGLPEHFARNLDFQCGLRGAQVRLVERCLLLVGRRTVN